MIIDHPDLTILPATRRPMSRDDLRAKLRQLIIIRNQHPREYDPLRATHQWEILDIDLPANEEFVPRIEPWDDHDTPLQP